MTPDLATKPTLEGELVVLRPFREGDVEVMAEILSDPEVRASPGDAKRTVGAAVEAKTGMLALFPHRAHVAHPGRRHHQLDPGIPHTERG